MFQATPCHAQDFCYLGETPHEHCMCGLGMALGRNPRICHVCVMEGLEDPLPERRSKEDLMTEAVVYRSFRRNRITTQNPDCYKALLTEWFLPASPWVPRPYPN